MTLPVDEAEVEAVARAIDPYTMSRWTQFYNYNLDSFPSETADMYAPEAIKVRDRARRVIAAIDAHRAKGGAT